LSAYVTVGRITFGPGPNLMDSGIERDQSIIARADVPEDFREAAEKNRQLSLDAGRGGRI